MVYIIRTIVLFLIGLWLKHKFRSELNFNSLKIVMMQVFLPAVIFYLILNRQESISSTGLWSIISATLFLNFLTFACAKYVLPRLLPGLSSKITNTNAVMLSAYAPCITVVPLAAAISTDVNTTYAALFDIGDKLFIFVILFAYISIQVQEKSGSLWQNVSHFGRKILLQPINLALFSSLILSSQGITLNSFPPVLQQVIADIKGPLLILIPIFIAGVINFQNLSRTLVSVLMYKYGFGFIAAAVFLFCFPEVIPAGLGLLVVTAPLASSSMWAKQNLMEFNRDKVVQKFDLEFAEDLFTNSFGLSLILNFVVFSVGDTIVNPLGLLISGLGMIIASSVIFRLGPPPARIESEIKEEERELVGSGV